MSFDVIQVQQYEVARKGLRTIGPQYVTRKDGYLIVQGGAPLSCMVVIPDDCRVSTLGFFRRIIHAPAMFSPVGNLELNPDQPYLLAETVVHELVHYYQRSRMGPPAYAATYLWQALLAIVKPGRMHDVHLMEREARRIAEEIVEAWRAAGSVGPIDAVLEIQRRLR